MCSPLTLRMRVPVFFEVGIVHRSQIVRVLALVLRHIRLVDPGERVHEQVVHAGGEVAHKGHEEEGDLEDGVFDVFDALDHVFVPGRVGEVGEEAEEGDGEADGPCLC